MNSLNNSSSMPLHQQMKQFLKIATLAILTTSCIVKSGIDVKITSKESKDYTITPSKLFISGGTTISITGKNLNNLSSVNFDNKECRITNRINQNNVQCLSPSAKHGESLKVLLKFNNGNSTTLNQTIDYSISHFNEIKLFAGANALAGVKNNFNLSKFFYPSEIVAMNNFLYVADSKNHVIRRIDLTTNKTITLIGKDQTPGDLDGYATDARINIPFGMAANSTDLFFSDRGNCKIKKFNFNSMEVVTIAGTGTNCDIDDTEDNPVGTLAILSGINGLDIDGQNLYLAETTQIRIISLTPPFAVTTLMTSLYIPTDLTILNSKVYFAEHYPTINVDSISYIDLNNVAGGIVPVAGSSKGDVIGEGANSKFNAISSLANDGTFLYVSDSYNNKIKKVDPATGATSLITGQGANVLNSIDGSLDIANIYRPSGLYYLNNTLYVASFGSHSISKIDMTTNKIENIAGGKK